MLMSHAAMSPGAIGRPRFGDCAWAGAGRMSSDAPANVARTSCSAPAAVARTSGSAARVIRSCIDIGRLAFLVDSPARDRIEVIDAAQAALGDERGAGRLDH